MSSVSSSKSEVNPKKGMVLMCGIAGFVTKQKEKSMEVMLSALSHRGPDGRGVWKQKGVTLGHVRLAILDPEKGEQPWVVKWEGNTYALTFNGEIYNYLELRKNLQREGFAFQTDCDTEVLLYAYLAWGVNFLKYLNGMFAFALYDGRKKSLLLARDFFGQKPLYYSFLPHSFLFASEPKALLPFLSLRLNRQALAFYLCLDYIPAPYSIYEGVQKLPAGSFIQFSLSSFSLSPPSSFFPSFFPSREMLQNPEASFAKLFCASIQRHLRSHVPLGIFLSGGLDSTSILSGVKRIYPQRTCLTFSVGFEEESYDERLFTRLVSRFFQTEHREVVCSKKVFLETFLEMSQRMDEPFSDHAAVPSYLLSRLASRYVKVVLGGEGSDELLAGYFPFLAILPANWYRCFVPPWLHKRIYERVRRLPVSEKYFSFEFRLKRFLKGALSPPHLRFLHWMCPHSEEVLKELGKAFSLQKEHWQRVEDYFQRFFSPLGRKKSELEGAFHFFQRLYLPEDILYKLDRTAMFHSLEGRSPFLDLELAFLANSLSSFQKFRKGLEMKSLLKRALKKWIPREILKRKKQGFGVPLAKWMKEDFIPPFLEDIRKSPIPLSLVQRILEEHKQGRENHSKSLWNLWVLGRWWRVWMD